MQWDDRMMRRSVIHRKNNRRVHTIGQKGYTLVELLVTFALLAIFVTAVVMCLPGITKIYMQLQQINHEKTICNTVSNEIRNALEGIAGVEGDGDPLGVKTGNGIGYLMLLDEDGRQISITSDADSTQAVHTDQNVTGAGIEFAYMDGIVAQMDTKGFTGYTMRKTKLQAAYQISPGAIITRYYAADSEKNERTTTITYNSAENKYSVASGVAITDGEHNVAYAIQYPYVEQFYEGFELRTNFTIKKDAFYTAGSGTEDSPQRTYVNYVNYTLSLYKDGDLRYSQEYVVNIQNAVPYGGTTVAKKQEKEDTKEEDTETSKDTYVVSGSNEKIWDLDLWLHLYQFTLHIAPSMDEQGADTWIITFPDNIKLKSARLPDDHGSLYKVEKKGNAIRIERDKKYGFYEEDEIKIYYRLGSSLDDLSALDGSKYITSESTPYATPTNSEVTRMDFSHEKGYDSIINCTIRAKEQAVKVYMEFTYDEEVESAELDETEGAFVEVDGKTVRVYGHRMKPNVSDSMKLKVNLKGGDGDETVEPVSVLIGGKQYKK